LIGNAGEVLFEGIAAEALLMFLRRRALIFILCPRARYSAGKWKKSSSFILITRETSD
jgi:hypothetical protein